MGLRERTASSMIIFPDPPCLPTSSASIAILALLWVSKKTSRSSPTVLMKKSELLPLSLSPDIGYVGILVVEIDKGIQS